MKEDFFPASAPDCSCLRIDVQVSESWINRFLSGQQLTIPVSDKYNLVNLNVELEAGRLSALADVREKEGSSVKITCVPKWDAGMQQLVLEDLKIDTVSKNILLKGAGWFATTFMSASIDKKIEEATSKLYAQQLQTLLAEGIRLPVKDGGSASVQVKSITIKEMHFMDRSVSVVATVDGYFKLQLDTNG